VSFNRLATALDQGVENGVFADEALVQGIELAAARTWLFLLGYIKDDNKKKSLDGQLQTGLARFCVAAGIEQAKDGLSDQILDALTRLLSFEPPLPDEPGGGNKAIDRFGNFDLHSPLMLRAISVRLYALDLTKKLPGKQLSKAEIIRGLAKLSEVFSLLQLDSLPAGLTQEAVDALFDHKLPVQRLRKEKHALTLAHPPGSGAHQRRKSKALVKSYVNAIGRIELWLIGYLSRPREKMWPRDASNRSLPAAMRAFWRDQPETERPSRAHLEDLTGFFFDRVQVVMESVADDEHAQEEELQQKLLNDPELARKVKRETESLGSRLIDGIRRVARFIAGWIRKGLGGLIALARNIASVLASRARNVFAAVRDVVFSIGDSWKFLTSKPLPGSDPQHLVMIHDRDFDFMLLVNPQAKPDRVLSISSTVAAMARLFSYTSRLVDQLVSAFINIAKKAGIGGWFGAVLAMLSFRSRLREIKDVLRQIREQRLLIEAVA
jgi:hypothetical protein